MADEQLYFSIKTKAAESVQKILNKEQDIELDGINVLEDLLVPGRIIFIVLGGDKPAWETGLIGIGVLTKPPYDQGYSGKNFKVQVSMKLLLHHPIKRADLVPYKDTYGTIGIAPITKWEPNQALSQVSKERAIALFRAMLEIDPSIEADLDSLIGNEMMSEVKATTTKMVEVPTLYGENERQAMERYIQNGQSNITATTGTVDDITPEWFREKASEFAGLDKKASEYLEQFIERFSVDKLQILTGKNILNEIFLNKDNKTNLCYTMEFDNDCRFIFGSIKSGTAYKYGLHYSQKNQSWATGTGKKPQFLSEEEAIELGAQIRDYLIAGIEVIKNYGNITSISDYEKLQDELYDATEGYVNKMWFMKYFSMMFPEIFPPIYSSYAQKTVLDRLDLGYSDHAVVRMGMIKFYVDSCGISNIVFSRIFWKYCNTKGTENDEEETVKEENRMKSCLEIEREPRTNKVHPINFIVYGAPGTGKTYSMVEYALAIVDNIPIEEFRKKNTDRKANMIRYKELVKAGQIVFTTFHQNYGYEEFIQGLRPDRDSETMAFKTVDGVFKVIADTALNDTEDKNFVIIIDEINRANISKVFGELITLIEEDKRWGELNETSVTLQSGDSFAVPNNLYIVGTMNSADKSISLIDAALRRRFDFIEQKPDSSLVPAGVLRIMFDEINQSLVSQLDSTDLLVGHSYFMNKGENELCGILNNNIIPLLYEYFYDDRKKVATLLKNAIDKSGAKVEIVDEKVGRLRVKDKVE